VSIQKIVGEGSFSHEYHIGIVGSEEGVVTDPEILTCGGKILFDRYQ